MTAVAPSPAVSAGPRATASRWRFWIVVAVVVLVAAVIGIARAGAGVGGQRLAPDNPGPQGAMAVAEVLRAQGVDVVEVGTTQEALDALGAVFGSSADHSRDATLVVHDPSGILDRERVERLAGAAGTLVLLEPGWDELDVLAPGVRPAGQVQGAAEAGCDDPAAQRAGSIIGTDRGYWFDDDVEATGCFRDPVDERYRLVVLDEPDRVIVLGATSALTNEAATADGNGALALGLLGEHPRLVWLVPTAAEYADSAAPTIGELSPGWVVPLALLAGALAVAAAIWRGRRLGPLVIEPLPVTVPASETMRGRARLYASSRSRLRAADALRLGSIGRLAADAGQSSSAGVDEIAAAVAALTGRPVAAVRDLLVDRIPASDRELLAISDELAELERELRTRTRPGE